ncbi:DNA gyrase inhibitor YacG [Alterisphingorhabdus coralli]|uniref:DNA gyrase inhibitor YacG n=1 Tax=Alterisphingorhabdus coralli TaxID=3071408 RepID=A0AA97F995_9SPHN|nr:DNA gyrase inhibitor YacG [Parasphingorhabdus sp. SCSIO 66989]WOE75891.1 DNA gyrase inhibitor YacG [Parasphingorhabdus sp. SCSIO 66989]
MTNTPASPQSAKPRAPKCPLCKKPTVSDYAPFCSRGCRDRDLLDWFGENYRLPGNDSDMPSTEQGGEDGDGFG